MDWSFGDVLGTMIVFFFWFIFIWMFIAAFGDLFRRDDLSGWAKAGWVLLLVVLPFLGILIYMIVRPKIVVQDQMFGAAPEREQRPAEYSAAEEIGKLAKLQDEGKISAEEFESMKRKAIATRA